MSLSLSSSFANILALKKRLFSTTFANKATPFKFSICTIFRVDTIVIPLPHRANVRSIPGQSQVNPRYASYITRIG